MKVFGRLRDFVSSGTSQLRRRFSIHQVQNPMDCLPNEILVAIFSELIFDPREDPAFITTISQVCSRWRALSISTPALWTRIFVPFPADKGQLGLLARCLERSQAQPLSIQVDVRDNQWEWEEEDHRFDEERMETIARMCMPHASRWDRLEVLTDTWAPMWTFLGESRRIQYCSLNSVSLQRCNAYFAAHGQEFEPESLREPLVLFGGAHLTNLRSVTLVGVHVDWDNSPLQNLHCLELKYHASDVMPTLSQFVNILNRCPDLQELAVIGWGPIIDQVPDNSIHGSITLPCVTKFSFGFINPAYSTTLLSMFQLPSLRKLYLEGVTKMVEPFGDHDSSQYLQWLYTTQPNPPSSSHSWPRNQIPIQQVCELELRSIISDTTHFARLFACFPSLSSLTLDDVPDYALDVLSHEPDSGFAVCPSLATLLVRDNDPWRLLIVVSSRLVSPHTANVENATLECVNYARPAADSDMAERMRIFGVSLAGPLSEGESSDSE